MDYLEIVRSVGILSGIGGGLALLMSVAKSTIGNYGIRTITINDDKKVEVQGGDSLLFSLIEHEIFIPSACGGKGTCGYCKCQVLEGGGEILATELGYVTPEEAKNHIRLSCQVKVKQDLKVAIPEEYLSLRQYYTTVEKIVDVTDKIKFITLKLAEGDEIDFQAGQYVQILAPEYEKSDEEVYRAYSIVSSPTVKDRIELFIGYIPEGIATTYVHFHLKEGDPLQIIGPFGHFFYHDTDREMVLSAIGTGLAPIMSILRYMRDNNIHRKARVFFSARTRSDLYMMEELEEIQKAIPEIEYYFSLTRPEPEDNWEGLSGRVTDTIPQIIEDASNMEAYLCGNNVMIDHVVKVLKEKGMPEEHIHYDKFE
ncbi:MAG TPA: 2Fe-2S iron-sulfur cluster binding domain-containing protein [Tissierellia bacterium]|jgi:Na+-transporting NADH:ubiquinone oxidoreductase subunit F|nr:2Fe-2S iron-sulfur cluster binding domain-containing protein [Tissierellia bacterium]